MARTSAAARKIALAIVEDAQYLEKLTARARLGILAPAVEVMLFHYAYGKPPDVVDLNVSDVTAAKLQEMSDEELAKHAAEMSKAILEDAKREAVKRATTVADAGEDISLMQNDPPLLDDNVIPFRTH